MKKDLLGNMLQKEILARIGQGTYRAGGKLPPEREMALELNVSRITLRQAIAALRELGIVESHHGSGNYVRTLTRSKLPAALKKEMLGFGSEGLADIVEARTGLETLAVKLAARHRTRADVAALRRDLDDMRRQQDDLVRFTLADLRFHHALAVASRNRILTMLMASIAEQQRYSMLLTAYGKGEQRVTVRDHERIFAAVAAGDESAALRAMKVHLDRMVRRYTNPSKGPRR
jgi:GntR family transcriptional regulator, transcriptional repressor for pyruvate dehydrogenase complex